MVDAAEALQIGLVEGVHTPDKLGEEVAKLAGMILAKGPQAVHYAKSAISTGADLDLMNANRVEVILFAALFATDDKNEGMQAFLDKRRPEFKGK
jgi:enoyl-CoA hydratase